MLEILWRRTNNSFIMQVAVNRCSQRQLSSFVCSFVRTRRKCAWAVGQKYIHAQKMKVEVLLTTSSWQLVDDSSAAVEAIYQQACAMNSIYRSHIAMKKLVYAIF